MAEPATTAAPQASSRGGRGGRRGGPRRHHHFGSRRPHGSAPGVEQQAQSEPILNHPQPAVTAPREVPDARDSNAIRGSRGGRGREGGPRRGRGGPQQRSVVVSHRGRGGRGPPFVAGRGGNNSSGAGLRVTAPEFVPGQPVVSSFEQQVTPAASNSQAAARGHVPKSTAADLPTRIHEDIDNHQYECVICTNEVLRKSRIWSCSICWTVTHLSCVKKWHKNQMSQREENQGRGGQVDSWRCPGCNSTLTEEPGPYRCWCGKDADPKPIPGLPPHTCGQTCSKQRTTCPHQCSLMCHAGPCPPCTLMGPTQTCFCGKNTSTKRCSETDYGKGWNCEEPCGDLLACGEHFCTQPCHAGLCGACKVPMQSTCYCGKEQRELPCNQRDDVLDSFNYGQLEHSSESASPQAESDNRFEGSFRCGKACSRPFDCGHHKCQQPCHPQDERPAHCPLSPDVVTHCPCGKTTLASMSAEPRQSCLDPVAHCDKPCDKMLACGHRCPDKCHVGSCAPCTQRFDITCRCGRTTTTSACHQGNIQHPLCFRVCRAQLNCGRHECGEHCCSGEKKAAERRKQKRGANENYEPEHICLQVCGRQLKCGKHTCQQLCHKGPCMSCPEAIFDEISCSCGRTVLQPPQPCGTRPPECRFPCTRARPCGHASVSHQCHSDETPCPKCPFLVEKPCICGKKVLKNQPCWLQEARCGLPCGKKLKCGTHECRKSCHKPGECEDAGISGSHCEQPCGKVRKSCEHTCVDVCHAPFPCKEDKPCQSKTFITCPCQHRKQEVRCQATKLNPWPTRESTLKCDDECLRLQRNQKLAEALHIDPATHTDDHVPYSDTTLKLFRDNINWAQAQEREFRVFAAAPEEKRLRFKPMPAHQRAFLHALAEDFGLDSESQDPEPHRHVCIFKTPRFVSAPSKTLAQCLRIATTAASLGTRASLLKPATTPTPSQQQQQQREPQPPFNALLLKCPRFGLTIDELDAALAKDLATASRAGIVFTTSFLPSSSSESESEEVVVKATPTDTAASIAVAGTTTPQAIEATLARVRSAVAGTVGRLGLASGVVGLCCVGEGGRVIRREGDEGSSAGVQGGGGDGWSAVASRGGGWRKVARQGAVAAQQQQQQQIGRVPSAFVALRRLEARKRDAKASEAAAAAAGEVADAAGGDAAVESAVQKPRGEEVVVEDWADAVDEEEREEKEEDGKEKKGEMEEEEKQERDDREETSVEKETEEGGEGGGRKGGEGEETSGEAENVPLVAGQELQQEEDKLKQVETEAPPSAVAVDV